MYVTGINSAVACHCTGGECSTTAEGTEQEAKHACCVSHDLYELGLCDINCTDTISDSYIYIAQVREEFLKILISPCSSNACAGAFWGEREVQNQHRDKSSKRQG